MGIQRENGYSAHVEGFFVFGEGRVRLVKTNECTITLAESCELPPGTMGELLVIVDSRQHSQLVVLPEGVTPGQISVNYLVAAPF